MFLQTFQERIQTFLQERAQLKLETEEKKITKTIATAEGEALIEAQTKWLDTQKKIREEHEPSVWLTHSAQKAHQLSMATHVIKFTHSDAKGSSLLDASTIEDPSWVCTANLTDKAIDVTGNAAVLSIAKFFQLESNGETLLQRFEQDDFSVLSHFSDEPSLVQNWIDGFKAALRDAEPATHTLAKQVYFPVGAGEYHLLAPLASSSLAHHIDKRVREARYSEQSVNIRQAKKAGVYHELPNYAFLNTAIQTFGGTQAQNVSQLNVARRGKQLLFSCQPPQWQQQAKPPLNVPSFFATRLLGRRTLVAKKNLLQFIDKHLQARSRIELRRGLKRRLDALIDEILVLMQDVHCLHQTQHQLWSTQETCRLSMAERIWLEPEAYDESAHAMAWKQEVAERFSQWIVGHIQKNSGLQLNSAESKFYQKALFDALHMIRFPQKQRSQAPEMHA